MSRLRLYLSRLRGLLGQRRRDRELAAEMDAHLQMEVDDLARAGLPIDEARRQALIKSGGIEAAQELYRDQRGVPVVESILQTFRQAAAGLKRTPGYAAAVLISIALGVGANTSMFAIADAVLQRPLPFADSPSLLTVGVTNPTGVSWELFPPDLEAWTNQSKTLGAVGLVDRYAAVVAGDADAEYVDGSFASVNLLTVLGTAPAIGRWFNDVDVKAGAPEVVVISHPLWLRQFEADPLVVGRVLRLYGEPVTVIGVLRAGTMLPLSAQFWLPLRSQQGQMIARPRSGAVSLAQIHDELTALSPTVANRRRRGRSVDLIVTPLQDQLFGSAAPAVRLLFGATVLLLLIACANVANLSLGRALDRRREWSVRAALGASRRSLAALVLAENAILICAGGAAGFAVASWAGGILTSLVPPDITLPEEVRIDVRSLLFAGFAVLTSIVLASIGPALAVTRRDLQPVLRQHSARHGRGPAAARLRRLIVMAELGTAVLLLIGAALVVKSVATLTHVDLGFEPHGLATASIKLTNTQYRSEDGVRQLLDDLRSSLMAAPGIAAVSFGPVPLVGGRTAGLREGFNLVFTGPGTADSAAVRPTVWVKYVDASYMDIFHIRLQAGRALQATDDAIAPAVAVLNRRAAAVLFPNGAALGHQLTGAPAGLGKGRPITVVGIIDDVRQRDVAMAAEPEILVPAAQQAFASSEVIVTVRADGNPRPLVGQMRQVLREVDPTLATSRLMTMTDVVDASLARYRFLLMLLGAFALLALALAMVGLYAMVSYLVAQRTREIGIRMALGARRSNVLLLVGRELALLVVVGATLGLGAAFALAHTLSGFLYEVEPRDAVAFTAGPSLLIAAALIAGFLPARRAAGVDPTITLRAE